VDAVPGAASVLIRFSEPVDPDTVMARLDALERQHVEPDDPGQAIIDVRYDGVDLDEVGRLTGLGPEGVVTAHTAIPWRVAFCGFAPGFGYLTGGDQRLGVPRRDTPRDRVPAGSVGLAGEYSGVYPSASPGGWQLIGRTQAVLWDLQRDPPALLQPGMTVRFRAVREAVTATGTPAAMESAAVAGTPAATGTSVVTGIPAVTESVTEPAAVTETLAVTGTPAVTGRLATPAPTATPATPTADPGTPTAAPPLTVLDAGIQCTVQDLGRPGWAHAGVSPSGAADLGAAVRANRIVGNDVRAGVLEILLGAAEFRFAAPTVLAVTGPAVDILVTDESGAHPGAMDAPVPVAAGARVRLGRARRGLRSYLAVRGGIAVRPVLGSRSTDVLSGIGPPVVRSGDRLPLGDRHWGTPHPVRGPDLSGPARLHMTPGPQAHWLADGVQQSLGEAPWTVSPSSNRVGIRLTGPQLGLSTRAELPSQGLVRGAVQLPPSGELVVFLADHPVTGGYPVIGVLTAESADRAAQLRPGQAVTLAVAGKP
jgi:KipI family sensor histidine kinase inhibitor